MVLLKVSSWEKARSLFGAYSDESDLNLSKKMEDSARQSERKTVLTCR